jgi:glycerol-3-phosphate acyltransferase PlsY
MSVLFLVAVVSYLLGSIPFGYLLVSVVRGEDVRRRGSGNIGATNVARTSPFLGVLTLILDAAKGGAAVWIAAEAYRWRPVSTSIYVVMSLAALFAVLAHIFPVWLRFRGGKGVATGLGSFLVLAPKAVLVALGVFLAIAVIVRYISLASITAVALFPLMVWLLHEYGDSAIALALISLASLAIVIKHHTNISRLLAGTENRFGSRRA